MSELAMLKYVNTGGNPALVKSIHIENPHFNEGSLRAMVYWTLSLNTSDENHTVKDSPIYLNWWPKVCFGSSQSSELSSESRRYAITTESFYELDKLLFGCHYEVTLSVASANDNNNPRASYTLTFETPSCEQFKSVLGNVLACPTTNFDVPSMPENLFCKVQLNTQKQGDSNLSAECFWDPPQVQPALITGYRVVSGIQLTNDQSTLDKSTATMRILKPDTTSLKLNDLLTESTYVVIVEALSNSGVGQQSSTAFTTTFVSFNDGYRSPHFLSVNGPEDVSLVLEEIEYAGAIRPVRNSIDRLQPFWIQLLLLLAFPLALLR